MVTQTWISGRIGDWFTAANWTTGHVPAASDTAVINAGTATVSSGDPAVQGISILLGGLATGDSVTLEAIDASFGPSPSPAANTVLTVSGGNPVTSPLNATFLVEGNTSF